MDIFTDDAPRPIIIDGLPPIGGSRRKSAGTKFKCIFCKTKTYRSIAGRAVCSYCSSKIEAKELERKW